MTRLLPSSRRAAVLVLLAGVVAVAASTTDVHARKRLSAEAVEQAVVVENGFADAKFKIKLTNDDDADFTNVFVVFSDETQVSLGDVAAGQSVLSVLQTRVIDLSDHPSKNIPLRVTLKFTANGDLVEMPWVLTVRVQ